MTTELWQLSATELAARIARRETTARAATESVLTRIAVANPQVNALASVTPDKALQAADAADAPYDGDALSQRLRLLDSRIQKANWATEVPVPDWVSQPWNPEAPVTVGMAF